MQYPTKLIRPRAAGAACIASIAAVALFAACSSNKSKKTEVTPPTLVFEGFENTNGEHFDVGETIAVACDPRITVHLGPSTETAHLLDNWELRPPANCGDRSQCGFIQLILSYKDGSEKLVNRASLAIVLEAEMVNPDLQALTARLLDGRDGEGFVFEEEEVRAVVDLAFSFDDCGEPGMGGQGGAPSNMGGSTNGSPGGAGLGGAGF